MVPTVRAGGFTSAARYTGHGLLRAIEGALGLPWRHDEYASPMNDSFTVQG